MGEVLGGEISEGEDIAEKAGPYDTILVYVTIPTEDVMSVGVPSLPLHAHERTAVEEHVKVTLVFKHTYDFIFPFWTKPLTPKFSPFGGAVGPRKSALRVGNYVSPYFEADESIYGGFFYKFPGRSGFWG